MHDRIHNMEFGVSHSIHDEDDESKALWFQSLSVEERMDYFCELTDFFLAINPSLLEKTDDQPTQRRVLVVEKPRG